MIELSLKVLSILDALHLRVPLRTVVFGTLRCARRWKVPLIRHRIAKLEASKRREFFATGRKIRVCFACIEKSQWIFQSVYETMRNSSDFDPVVLICPTWVRNNDDKAQMELRQFFANREIDVVDKLDTGNLPDVLLLPRFDDFAFSGVLRTRDLYDKVLISCQIYAWITHNCDEYYFGNDDLAYLWKYFVFNHRDWEVCRRLGRLVMSAIVEVGFPRNDEFVRAERDLASWKNPTNTKIIWAPHWSVLTHGHFGNFDRIARPMLDWLKAHPKVDIVLKPHPLLRARMTDEVTKGKFRANNPNYREPVALATVEEYDAFMAEWAAQPNGSVMNSGGYADLFASSDAMVLDSGSFLAEYMFFNKPMCFCNRDRTQEELMLAFNDFGRDLFSGIEVADDFGAIEKFMDDVVRGVDRLKDERIRVRGTYLMKNVGRVGEAITQYIREQLKG